MKTTVKKNNQTEIPKSKIKLGILAGKIKIMPGAFSKSEMRKKNFNKNWDKK
jgi:hypothetical protein